MATQQDDFAMNLLRAVAAELYYLCGLQTAREMFGKGYFALGQAEKITVDQAALAMVASNFQMLTPDFLKQQKGSVPGFQIQTPDQAPEQKK